MMDGPANRTEMYTYTERDRIWTWTEDGEMEIGTEMDT